MHYQSQESYHAVNQPTDLDQPTTKPSTQFTSRDQLGVNQTSRSADPAKQRELTCGLTSSDCSSFASSVRAFRLFGVFLLKHRRMANTLPFSDLIGATSGTDMGTIRNTLHKPSCATLSCGCILSSTQKGSSRTLLLFFYTFFPRVFLPSPPPPPPALLRQYTTMWTFSDMPYTSGRRTERWLFYESNKRPGRWSCGGGWGWGLCAVVWYR